jgi:hypothetical protein
LRRLNFVNLQNLLQSGGGPYIIANDQGTSFSAADGLPQSARTMKVKCAKLLATKEPSIL